MSSVEENAVGGGGKSDGTQVLARALGILKIVARNQRTGATLAAITRAADLSRSTAFRIVHFLSDEGMLEFDAESGTYRVGALAFELGLAAGERARYVAHWEEIAGQLCREIGMTAYLVARSDADIVCLAKAEAPAILRAVPLVVGQRFPLGIGSGAIAILAALGDTEAGAILEGNRAELTAFAQGRFTIDELWERIRRTRKLGYAFSEGSIVEGVGGLSIHIPDPHTIGSYAFGVSAPSAQVNAIPQAQIAKVVQHYIDLGLRELRG